jgi:DeoR family galactitol utilization operon repressor
MEVGGADVVPAAPSYRMIEKLNDRERGLLDLIVEEPRMSVTDLSKALEVSPVTVRTTLNSLAEKGMILRTWGGANPAFHPEILERQRTFVAEKNRIAQAAAEIITDTETVMIEAGTTTSGLGRYLFGKREIRVVTNSSLILPYARANPQVSLILSGGDFRPSTESFVGPAALEHLARFNVRYAFIGTDGFSPEAGLTTHHLEGAEVVKRMAAQADETILLADSSKWRRRGFAGVLPLTAVAQVITDTKLSDEAAGEMEELGIRVRRV